MISSERENTLWSELKSTLDKRLLKTIQKGSKFGLIKITHSINAYINTYKNVQLTVATGGIRVIALTK